MRLFLAVELPKWIREELEGVQHRLKKSLPGWRWARPEGIHLTFRFLGEVRSEDEAVQRSAWRRAAASCRPVRLRVGGLGVFPARGPARVLWVGVRESSSTGRLEALASGLEEAARAVGFPSESRGFRAHLTLARAARGASPCRPPEGAVGELGELEAAEIVLFRSHLSADGARYDRLDAFPLGMEEPGR